MKTEIQELEDSILEMELKFSRNEAIDVALLIEKTKKLSALQVKEAREEGLRAGLVIQNLKKQREPELSPPVPVTQVPEPVSQVAEPLVEEPVAVTQEPVTPQYRRIDQEYYANYVPPQAKFKAPSPTDVFTKLSELNLGKYVMGVLAAILAITGTIVLGSLMWNDISNEMKAIFFGIVATLMIFFPFRHILAKESREGNGFLTSLIGAGLSIHYLNCIFMGTSWDMLSDSALLIALIGLVLLTVGISHHIKSNTLLLVSFIGNFMTLMLIDGRETYVNQLYLSLIFLLVITVFLILYALKNDWTVPSLKIISVIFGVLVLARGEYTIEEGNRALLLQLNSMNAMIPAIHEVNSVFFALFLILVVFGILMGLAMGYVLSRCDDFGITQEDQGQDSAIFQTFGLAFSYIVFSIHFFEHTFFLFPLILSTFVLNQRKSVASFVSTPFLCCALIPIALFFEEQIHFPTQYAGGELIYLYIILIIAFALHFFTKNSDSNGYKASVLIYSIVAFFLSIFHFQEPIELLPFIILLACLFYSGFEEAELESGFSLLYLLTFVPFALVLGKLLWAVSGEFDHPNEYFAPCLLFVTFAIRLGQRYSFRLANFQNFQILLLITQLASFFFICGELNFNSQELPLMMLHSLGIFLMLIQNFYLILRPKDEAQFKYEKIFALGLSLLGLVAWTQTTPLGEFGFTSSILVLLMGCLSIYLGFRQQETELRHFGLALCILGVIKMVTIDVASTDSVIRVVALILGAVLCFIISCVYNKIEPDHYKMDE